MSIFQKRFFLSFISCFLFLTITLAIIQINNKNVKIEHRLQWWLSAINYEYTDIKYAGKNIKIAILDTGVNNSHPDLAHIDIKNMKISSVSSEKDDKTHGTAIAGIIAGYPSNPKGVLGIAPEATIISIDITDLEYVEAQNIITGIKMAIEENVDIISISLGLKEDNIELHKIIKKAYEQGITIVSSAGNYMTNDVLYPAKYEEVLCVGSLDKNGKVISPKGNPTKNTIFLPGENIVTTGADDVQYFGANGTSFSTAILAGTIALMKEANPEITNKELHHFFNFSNNNAKFDLNQCISYAKEV